MIYINNVLLAQQPSDLLEELVQIQSENTSLAGAMQRNRVGQKKQSTMVFSAVSPATYQTLIANFTTGSGVYYYNDQSNYAGNIFTISGLPFFQESSYVQGGSLNRDFQVRIREA